MIVMHGQVRRAREYCLLDPVSPNYQRPGYFNTMARILISQAVVILVGCLFVPAHAQAPAARHLSSADVERQSPATGSTPVRIEGSQRPEAQQEPGNLDVAQSLGKIRLQDPPASRPSARRRIQASEADGGQTLPLQGPLKTASDAARASEEAEEEEVEPLDAPGTAGRRPPAPRLLHPLTSDDAASEEQEADVEEQDEEAADEPSASSSSDEAAADVPDVPARPLSRAPAEPAREFSPEMIRLRDKIRACLSYYYQRPTSINDRSPWGVMHSLISFGVDTQLQAGGRRVNAIAWLCSNRPCRGLTLFSAKNGRLALRNGPGYQGHEGQLLSMLALCRVQVTYPLRVDGYDFTVADLVELEQRQCRPKSELSFQLIGLAHYLPSDATWKNDRGEEWSIPRMIREELAQPINGVACGGTHRLIGLSMAVKTRVKRGEPLDGEWLRAHKFVTAYQQYAFKLQNPDGSFSTKWLERREALPDIERRMQTTGHILEWLVFSLPEDQLTDPRLVKSINYLATLLWNNRSQDWEIGPRGHALRALVLYNERVFGDKPGELHALLAQRPGK